MWYTVELLLGPGRVGMVVPTSGKEAPGILRSCSPIPSSTMGGSSSHQLFIAYFPS
jgi:hypothetical protein